MDRSGRLAGEGVGMDLTWTPQHMVALGMANKTRFAIAATKREVHAGRKTVADVLRSGEPPSLKVWELLTAQPQWGRRRAARVMTELSRMTPPVTIGQDKRLGDLTPRQRDALIYRLTDDR
jgi:hypothetical protein